MQIRENEKGNLCYPILEVISLVAWAKQQGINSDTAIYQCVPRSPWDVNVEIVCRDEDDEYLTPPVEALGQLGNLTFCQYKEWSPPRTKMLTLQSITFSILGTYDQKENIAVIGDLRNDQNPG